MVGFPPEILTCKGAPQAGAEVGVGANHQVRVDVQPTCKADGIRVSHCQTMSDTPEMGLTPVRPVPGIK